MKRSLWKPAVAVIAGALATATFASPVSAAPSAGDTALGDAVSHAAATTVAEAERVAEYWTPERMLSATPMDAVEVSSLDEIQAVPRGEPVTVRPTPALADSNEVGPTAFPHGGGPWTGGGEVVSTTGRVFFTHQGQNASCSGSAVTSANNSTVLTAGHCVKLEGSWHTNWAFVPAYDNGDAPYGTWPATSTLAAPQWVASEDISYDIGAAVVGQVDGQYLTDVVGGQGVAFNQARGLDMYAFGYPAASPYDGSRLIYCSGGTFDAFLSSGLGMTCDMTGGSSGGPWFTNFDESSGAGMVNSVNSYKIIIIPFWMFGPYFGSDAENVYNEAQSS